MNATKTGAVICKTPDKVNQYAYKPLAFINGIPDAYSDEDFKTNFNLSILGELTKGCHEILFRADIHATSNEVQEEFEKLHDDWASIPQFAFRQMHISI